MQSKMTPGPWSAFDNAGENLRSYSQSSGVVNGNGMKIICGCFNDIGGVEVASANAKAIAAVPDLIEALQTVLGIENFQALETVRYGGVPIAQIVKDALRKAGF